MSQKFFLGVDILSWWVCHRRTGVGGGFFYLSRGPQIRRLCVPVLWCQPVTFPIQVRLEVFMAFLDYFTYQNYPNLRIFYSFIVSFNFELLFYSFIVSFNFDLPFFIKKRSFASNSTIPFSFRPFIVFWAKAILN